MRLSGEDSFAEAVAGEPIKGSWWGHPKGKEIFNLANALEAECVFVKLIDGKETIVHESLYAALARVVTDEEWRAERIEKLSKDAKKLLREVEKSGAVRGAPAKARLELQRALLVHSAEEHTESGKHVTVLQPWAKWITKDVAKAAKKLSLTEALRELAPGARGPRET
ncbi:MAG: hypothetical protein ACAI25_18900 [Planctomycetota bacterium]